MKKLFAILISAVLLLSLTPLSALAMSVNVETPNGVTVTVEAEQNDSVEAIKGKVQEKCGIPPEQQVILLNGVTLEEGKTLAEYGVIEGTTLSLTLKREYNQIVTATYTPGVAAAEIISVDIAWGAMSFSYTDESEGTWDPATHEFVDKTPAKWENVKDENGDPTNKISVTNHSNTEINAVMTFTKAEGTDIEGSFDKAKLTLDSAEGKTVENAPTSEAVFNVTGGSITADGTIGTIAVAISKVVWTEVSDETELKAAVATGKDIKLTGNIEVSESINIQNNTVIDLNGYTISGDTAAIFPVHSNSLTLKNGTIKQTRSGRGAIYNYATICIDNCSVEANSSYALMIDSENGSATVTNSKLIGADSYESTILLLNGTLILGGNIELEKAISMNPTCTLTIIPGTYNFDPAGYVDTTAYIVTANTDGTWTVAAK